jgi:predicted TIM-barrel fold metal-dependent hydrolase
MIDAHIHVVPPNLPGVGPLNPLLEANADVVAATLRTQMHDAGITAALAMGSWQAGDDDPLGIAATLRIAALVPGLHPAGIADPTRTDVDHLRRVEEVLATGRVKALKAYLGYLHYAPDHLAYRRYYELAEKYNLPVIFHTGDTYSPWAKVRFAQPLRVDDVAVDHPKVRFVIAHIGNPWMTDAAEVVYKNMNVWADLSGLVVGEEDAFTADERQDAVQDVIEGIRRTMRYAERPNRFLYGSDWPLAPMPVYRQFIAAAVPEVYHEMIFEHNARALFRF